MDSGLLERSFSVLFQRLQFALQVTVRYRWGTTKCPLGPQCDHEHFSRGGRLMAIKIRVIKGENFLDYGNRPLNKG